MAEKKTLNSEQIVELERLSGIRLPMDQIAAKFGMDPKTLDHLSKKDDAVRSAIARGRAAASEKYRETAFLMAVGQKEITEKKIDPGTGKEYDMVIKSAIAPSERMMEFWGKTQEGFAITEKHELTGKDGGPIKIDGLDALTDEELDAREKKVEEMLRVIATKKKAE